MAPYDRLGSKARTTLTKSTHADRLLALLSGDGLLDVLTTKDVGDQLGIRAFSSLFPLAAS